MRSKLRIAVRIFLACLVLVAMYLALLNPFPNLNLDIPIPNSGKALIILPYAVLGIAALFGYLRASTRWRRWSWCGTIIFLGLFAVVELAASLRPEFADELRTPSTVLGYLLALFAILASVSYLRTPWLARERRATKHT